MRNDAGNRESTPKGGKENAAHLGGDPLLSPNRRLLGASDGEELEGAEESKAASDVDVVSG